MKLIVYKLLEVLSRALFVLVCMFEMEVADSGRFGLLVTGLGVFAFLIGFERHIDIQRTKVGTSDRELFRALISAFSLFARTYSVWVPIFFIVLFFGLNLSVSLALLCILIGITDHISNFSYNLAVINPRFRNLMLCVTVKHVLNALAIMYLLIQNPQSLILGNIILVWCFTSILSLIAILALLWRYELFSEFNLSNFKSFRAQFEASKFHFFIGFLALATLQFDRFLTGFVLNIEEVGSFFRHVMLISFMHQFFNIVSFNRKLPKVFEQVKAGNNDLAIRFIRKEWWTIFLLLVIGSFVGWFIHSAILHVYFDRYHLDIYLLYILLAAFWLRAGADFNGMIYNANHKEQTLFKIQIATLFIGTISFMSLAIHFGLIGAVFGTLSNSLAYFVLTQLIISKVLYKNE